MSTTKLSEVLPVIGDVSVADTSLDFVILNGERIPVVNMTEEAALAAGWTFTESDGELTITDVPTLSAPTHVRIPDFVDGLPVRQIGTSVWEGDPLDATLFRKSGTRLNLTGVTSLTLQTVGNSFVGGLDDSTEYSHSCENLSLVNLPSLTTAGDLTFYQCTSLEFVHLPALTTTGSGTFWNCSSLESVPLPLLTTVGNSAFNGCTSLVSVKLPLLTTTGASTFWNCSSLESVHLPLLTTAGNSAFYNCSSLVSVFLGAHFTPSGTTNFYLNASQDLVIYYPPGDEGYGAFWPNASATENGVDARPTVPDFQRWSGPVNEGEIAIRDGNTFVSAAPWV